MGRSSTLYVKDSIWWCLGKSVHIEDTWVRAAQNRIGIVRHGDSSEDIDAQLSNIEDTGEKEYRSEITIVKLWRQSREDWNRSSGQELKGIKWRWRRKRYLLPVERKRPMFEGKPVQFPALEQRSCTTKTDTKCRHSSSMTRGRSVSRRKVSKAKVTTVPFFDNRADTIWKVLARDRFVSIGILPNVNSIKRNRDVKQEISVCSRIIGLTNNQTKSRKRATIPQKRREGDDKNAVAVVKDVSQMGCVSQDSELLDSQRGKQARWNPMQKVLGPIRRIRFTQSTVRHASIREKKGTSLGKIQVKTPHQRSPYAMKFEDGSQEETERQQQCARSKAWNLAKNRHKCKEKDKATFNSPAEEWVLPVASTEEP